MPSADTRTYPTSFGKTVVDYGHNDTGYGNVDSSEPVRRSGEQVLEIAATATEQQGDQTLQTFMDKLQSNHEDATLILLIGGFMFNTLWLISWAVYRRSPFATARKRAKVSGVIFLVVTAIAIVFLLLIGYVYIGPISLLY